MSAARRGVEEMRLVPEDSRGAECLVEDRGGNEKTAVHLHENAGRSHARDLPGML